MCGVLPTAGLYQSDTGKKVINNAPIGLAYKMTAGDSLTNSIKDRSIGIGLGASAAMKRANKSTQFSTAV